MRIAVTGSSGKIGRAAMAELAAAGHRVIGLDLQRAAGAGWTAQCDCTDFGQVMGALSGIDMLGGIPDAVIHLAGIPMPGLAPDQRIFETNTISTYNVMSACARLGIRRLAWASSETILGLPFKTPPAFVPLDETHPDRPEWSYALSKQLGETMADALVRWQPRMQIVSLRFSNVFVDEDYAGLAEVQAAPERRRANLWSYVDAHDAAQACRLAVETEMPGHERLIIAAPDTVMNIPTAELLGQFFAGVPLRAPLEKFGSLLNSERAARRIGFRARHVWRNFKAG